MAEKKRYQDNEGSQHNVLGKSIQKKAHVWH